MIKNIKSYIKGRIKNKVMIKEIKTMSIKMLKSSRSSIIVFSSTRGNLLVFDALRQVDSYLVRNFTGLRPL